MIPEKPHATQKQLQHAQKLKHPTFAMSTHLLSLLSSINSILIMCIKKGISINDNSVKSILIHKFSIYKDSIRQFTETFNSTETQEPHSQQNTPIQRHITNDQYKLKKYKFISEQLNIFLNTIQKPDIASPKNWP